MPKKKLSFEQAMNKLENIVELMEDPAIGIENLVNYYKEAVELSVFLDEALSAYELEVTELTKTAETFSEKKFEDERDNG